MAQKFIVVPLIVMLVCDILSMVIGANAGSIDLYSLVVGIGAILAVAIAIGSLGGMNILGSGLNTTSVWIAFMAVSLFGIWAIVSVAGATVLFTSDFGEIVYAILTILYLVGIIFETKLGVD